MKHKLPILPAAALGLMMGLASIPLLRPMVSASQGASAQDATTNAATQTDQAQVLLRRSAASLASLDSASAKIRLRVDLFGQQLTGSGRYLQSDSMSRQFRLELKMPLGDSFSSVQHVCDGKTLWIRRQIEGPPAVSKVDLSKIDLEAARSVGDPNVPLLTPAVGGLAGVLANLDRAFEFRWMAETTLGKAPLRAVYGTWKPSRLARLLPDQKAAIDAGRGVDLTKLPEHMPDHVVVYLGRDDMFPYRIEYRRTTDGDPAAAVRDTSTAKTQVSMELFEARFGSGVDRQEFVYTPGSTPVADETEAYLAGQGLSIVKPTP